MGLPQTLDPVADFGLPFSDHADVANPETDLAAAQYENLAIAVAGMTHTAPRAFVVVSGAATYASSAILDYAAVWGDTLAVRPTLAKVATGSYTLTWASSYADLNPTIVRQVTAAVSLRAASLQLHEQAAGHATVSGNAVAVHTYTLAGAAANKKFTVWVY